MQTAAVATREHVTHEKCGSSFYTDDTRTWWRSYTNVDVRYATCVGCRRQVKVTERKKKRHEPAIVTRIGLTRRQRHAAVRNGGKRGKAKRNQRVAGRKYAARKGYPYTVWRHGYLFTYDPVTGNLGVRLDFVKPVPDYGQRPPDFAEPAFKPTHEYARQTHAPTWQDRYEARLSRRY